MSTVYKHRVTIAVPVAMYTNFQHLEGAFGEGMNDHLIPRSPTHQDALGNQYIVISAGCTDTLLSRTFGGLVDRPGYDSEESIDLVAAQMALNSTLVVTEPNSEGVWIQASLDKILAILDLEPQYTTQIMGLVRIEDDVS